MSSITDFSEVVKVEREEMKGITALLSEGKMSIPLKLAYDDICVHEFYTGMDVVVGENEERRQLFNPRHIFDLVNDFAVKEINSAIERFETKEVVSKLSEHSWQIKNGFVTVSLCLHSYTLYNQSTLVFEDIATHRVAVSMVAYLDTKNVYRSETHSEEVFKEVNQFYTDLKNSLTK